MSTLAELVGKVSVIVDNAQLVALRKELLATEKVIKSLQTFTRKGTNFKVGFDSSQVTKALNGLEKRKIFFSNLDVSQQGRKDFQDKIQQKFENTPIRFKNIVLSRQAMKDFRKNLADMFSPENNEGQRGMELPLHFNTNNLRKNLRAALQEVKAKMLTNKGNMKEAFKFTIPVEVDQQAVVTKLMRSFNKVQKSLEDKVVNGKNGQYIRKGGLNLNVRLNFQRVQAAKDLKATLDSLKAELTVRVKSVVDAKVRDVSATGFRGSRASPAGKASTGFFGAGAGAGLMSSGFGAAFAGGGLGYGLFRANEAYGQFKANELAMNAVMGNKEDSQAQQTWLKNFSNDLGIVYQDALPSYTKMLASGMTAGMETDEISGIFEGVASYGQVMGLDSESLKGTYRAIEQMMNKGQIYSEELKGQLAERAPGVISAMAVAAGLNPETDKDATSKLFKMMEEGQLRAAELLPAFADELLSRANEGGALDEAKASTRAGKGRAITAFHDGLMLMNKQGGFDKAMGDFYTHLAEMMQRNPDFFIKLGKAATVVVQVLRSGMYVFERIWQAFSKWDDSLNGKGSLGVVGGIALLVMKFSPLGRIIGLVTAAVLALEEAFAFFDGKENSLDEWLSPEDADRLRNIMEGYKEVGTEVVELFKEMFDLASQVYDELDKIGLIDFTKKTAYQTWMLWKDAIVEALRAAKELIQIFTDDEAEKQEKIDKSKTKSTLFWTKGQDVEATDGFGAWVLSRQDALQDFKDSGGLKGFVSTYHPASWALGHLGNVGEIYGRLSGSIVSSENTPNYFNPQLIPTPVTAKDAQEAARTEKEVVEKGMSVSISGGITVHGVQDAEGFGDELYKTFGVLKAQTKPTSE